MCGKPCAIPPFRSYFGQFPCKYDTGLAPERWHDFRAGMPHRGRQDSAGTAQKLRFLAGETPGFEQHRGRHGPRSTRQGLPFDPSLVGPHPPDAGVQLGHKVHVGASGEAWIIPQLPAAAGDVDALSILDKNYEMRHAGLGESDAVLTWAERKFGVRPETLNRLQVYFGLVRNESRRYHARVGGEAEFGSVCNAKFGRQPRAAKRGVTAQLSEAPISVEVTYPKCFCGIVLYENNTVGANAGSPGAHSIDQFWGRQATRRLVSGVEKEEVVPRPAHLPELSSARNAHTRPVTVHQRSSHGVTKASSMIPLFILLLPWVRSEKTIGISTPVNPFLNARKLISI